MRGKVDYMTGACTAVGITPAHAGKSFLYLVYYQKMKDHPRTCGEKLHLSPFQLKAEGSPPHMRGKDLSHIYPRHQQRITPAHAGKSELICYNVSSIEDHPRTCGEKLKQ